MKIRITILFVLATWFVANAQQKRENNFAPVFGSENTKWYCVGGAADALLTDSMLFIKDSIIDGKNYKAFGFLNAKYVHFFLRASDDNSKLFFFDPRQMGEYVAMDLSLEKGDVFDCRNCDYYYKKITVDTVYYKDNRKHIRFNYIPHCQYGYEDSLMFIEGIGPNYLPFYSYQCYIRCKYVNDTLQYCGRLADDCKCVYEILGSIAKANGLQNKYLVSNIVTTSIELINIRNNTTLTIYSITGSIIKRIEINSSTTEMPIYNMKDGIYLIGIKPEGENEIVKKIVKTQ